METPSISIVIPTRNRARYLEVALASLTAQEFDAGYEVLVVDDGSTDDTAAVVERARHRYLGQSRAMGLNAARNAGVSASAAPVIAFLDDDVFAPAHWLRAVRDGAVNHPGFEAFGGPIRARFEGRSPSSCGRERPPITTLDLGLRDREADLVWGVVLARKQRLGFEFVEQVAERPDVPPQVGVDILAFLGEIEVGGDVVTAARQVGVGGEQVLQPLFLAHHALGILRIRPQIRVGSLLVNFG